MLGIGANSIARTALAYLEDVSVIDSSAPPAAFGFVHLVPAFILKFPAFFFHFLTSALDGIFDVPPPFAHLVVRNPSVPILIARIADCPASLFDTFEVGGIARCEGAIPAVFIARVSRFPLVRSLPETCREG